MKMHPSIMALICFVALIVCAMIADTVQKRDGESAKQAPPVDITLTIQMQDTSGKLTPVLSGCLIIPGQEVEDEHR